MSSDGSGGEGVPLEQIEDTLSIAADHDVVYTHFVTVEGLRITDAVTTDWRGGRALILVAPDGTGGSSVTMMADAPAGSEAAAEMRVRMRQELDRVAATLEQSTATDRDEGASPQVDDAEPVETGLDAIEDDQAEGLREAPFADDPSHRP